MDFPDDVSIKLKELIRATNFEGLRFFAATYLNLIRIRKMSPKTTVCEGSCVNFD